MRKSVFLRAAALTAGLALLFSWGCVIERKRDADIARPALLKVGARDFPEFADDLSYEGLEQSVLESLLFFEKKPDDAVFHFGRDRFTAGRMRDSLKTFLDFIQKNPSPDRLTRFIRQNYEVYASSANRPDGVLMTGYFEPVFKGSLFKTDECRFPVYGRPADMITIDLSRFSSEYSGKKIVARYEKGAVIPYFDREQITRKNAIKGKARAIAWLKDPVDVFFLHVQGSGKAILEDGRTISLRYDSQNGRPYRSIGRLLVEMEKIPLSEISMQSIRAYLAANPHETDVVLSHNPSYVFFREGDSVRPKGCIGAELTPGRSLATDRRIFPEGALAFIRTQKPVMDESGAIQEWTDMSRFVLNQDTGGAIRGPGRADIFWGDGEYAEMAAGHMKHRGEMFFLVLKDVKNPGGFHFLPRMTNVSNPLE
ncbi:conserved hypothetical protein [Candidatus Desulfarcum epimagneticum]|uniref:peptidoglycan lytic exotransglycosylase n=1 Tax=uncultured Desulfobacteraceae bacterium TaxID=218296 RepID=A0A484HHH7_9BACT|nr:conserved hypothetical protein [uncultured Desulfobacteraceae bacterium]